MSLNDCKPEGSLRWRITACGRELPDADTVAGPTTRVDAEPPMAIGCFWEIKLVFARPYGVMFRLVAALLASIAAARKIHRPRGIMVNLSLHC